MRTENSKKIKLLIKEIEKAENEEASVTHYITQAKGEIKAVYVKKQIK